MDSINAYSMSASLFRQEMELEPGETLCKMHMQSGFLIDQMSFGTSKGRTLGPFGSSPGGNKLKFFFYSMDRGRHFNQWNHPFHQRFTDEGLDEDDEEFFQYLALHGFVFSIVRTLDCMAWCQVQLVVSALKEKTNAFSLTI